MNFDLAYLYSLHDDIEKLIEKLENENLSSTYVCIICGEAFKNEDKEQDTSLKCNCGGQLRFNRKIKNV